MRVAAAVTALAVVLAGCNNYTAIKPTELPKLVGPTAGVTDDGRAIAVATRTVETPDGRMVEIRGDFELVIEDSSGEVELSGPFQVAVEDGMLIVKSDSTLRCGPPSSTSAPSRSSRATAARATSSARSSASSCPSAPSPS